MRPASPRVDVQNRMADFGIDAFWLSHEPWIVPRAIHPGGRRDVVARRTSTTGSTCSSMSSLRPMSSPISSSLRLMLRRFTRPTPAEWRRLRRERQPGGPTEPIVRGPLAGSISLTHRGIDPFV